MKLRNLLPLLIALFPTLTLFSCASNSGIGRTDLLHGHIPSVIQLSPMDSSFNHQHDFTLQQGVSFTDDSGHTNPGNLAIDTSSISRGQLFIASMFSTGRGYLDELPIMSEHSFSSARVGTNWSGNLKLYTIQRIDTVPGQTAHVSNEMRVLLLFDGMGDTYVLNFLPGCKFELPDGDSDKNGNFLRLGAEFEYYFSGSSGKNIPYYLLGRPAIARILHVEHTKRTR